ncbi:MAG: hypothetical protein WC718_04755 [Phycisphaerales bacterium]|jgi:hypothetical protein
MVLATAGSAGVACALPPAFDLDLVAAAAPSTDWLTVLRDGTAADRSRLGAAKALIAQSDDEAIREVLRAEIAAPLAGSGGGPYVLQALAAMPEAPGAMYPILAERLPKTPIEEVPKLLRALGSFRSREAARLLLEYAAEQYPDSVREAAFDSLEHLSGRGDVPREVASWETWMKEVEGLSDAQWRDSLFAALASRGDQEASRIAELTSKLADSLRKLHLTTPAEKRGELLEAMLMDTEPSVRNVGLELLSRELAASGAIDERVGDATLSLLGDSNPQVRASAARLVRQLAPERAPEAMARALVVERDSRAAAALLLGAARWPSPQMVEPTLKWLTSQGPAREPACDAAWALYKAGHLNDTNQRELLELVRAWPDDALTPSACGILATLGSSADRERLRPLLFAKDSSLRNAVIEALLWYPEFLGDIVKAAHDDPDLFDAASRALLQHEPTGAGLRTLLSLPRPSQDTALLGITRLAHALSATDLLAVTKDVKDEALRITLLRQLTADEREMSERVNPALLPALAEGMMTLADLQLSAREPDQALVTLESSPFFGNNAVPAPKGFRALRCAALAGLGRIDAADEAGGPPEAWVRGLEIAVKQPFAADLGAEIKRRFGAGLGEELDKRVDALLSQAATARATRPDVTPVSSPK